MTYIENTRRLNECVNKIARVEPNCRVVGGASSQ